MKTCENDAVAVSPDFDMIVAGDSAQGIRLLATSRGTNTAAHWGLAGVCSITQSQWQTTSQSYNPTQHVGMHFQHP